MDIMLLLLDETNNATDACGGLGQVVDVIHGLFDIFRIIVPILLLIMGAVDLAKAVMASDDKEIKAATTKLTKRAIAAAAVFLAVTIVEVVTGLINDKLVGIERERTQANKLQHQQLVKIKITLLLKCFFYVFILFFSFFLIKYILRWIING